MKRRDIIKGLTALPVTTVSLWMMLPGQDKIVAARIKEELIMASV